MRTISGGSKIEVEASDSYKLRIQESLQFIESQLEVLLKEKSRLEKLLSK